MVSVVVVLVVHPLRMPASIHVKSNLIPKDAAIKILKFKNVFVTHMFS